MGSAGRSVTPEGGDVGKRRGIVAGAIFDRLDRLRREFFVDVSLEVAPSHVRFCLFLNYISIFSGLAHLCFIPLFLHLGVRPLALYNVGAVVFFVGAWWINRKGHHYSAMWLMVAEYATHSLLAVRQVGWEFGFQYFIIGWSWVPFMAPAGRRVAKAFVLLAACGWFIYLTSFAGVSAFEPAAWQLREAPFVNAANLAFFCAAFAGCFLTFRSLVDSAEEAVRKAHATSESLLHNILPVEIAERLKAHPGVIADAHDATSVLFLDIVNYTPLSEKMTPAEVVGLLNAIFSRLDALAYKYGVEKIKTIGDAYMVAGGVPRADAHHAEAIGRFALDALGIIREFTDRAGRPLQARIGVDTGPVVAGVIGRHKFIYDLWGDIVNTAARMESHGVPDRIQASRRFQEHARGVFAFEPRGVIDVKGKGPVETFFLTGLRETPGGSSDAAGAQEPARVAAPSSELANPRVFR